MSRTRTRTMKNQQADRQPAGLTKRRRVLLARERRARLRTAGRTVVDLARFADVSYSMAEKYVAARRMSPKCDEALNAIAPAGAPTPAEKAS